MAHPDWVLRQLGKLHQGARVVLQGCPCEWCARRQEGWTGKSLPAANNELLAKARQVKAQAELREARTKLDVARTRESVSRKRLRARERDVSKSVKCRPWFVASVVCYTILLLVCVLGAMSESLEWGFLGLLLCALGRVVIPQHAGSKTTLGKRLRWLDQAGRDYDEALVKLHQAERALPREVVWPGVYPEPVEIPMPAVSPASEGRGQPVS